MAIKESTRILRRTSITTAVISLLLNTISLIVNKRTVNWHSPTDVLAWAYFPIILCIAGNYIILNAQYLKKKEIHPNFLIILDDCAFLGFLALLVANGVIISNLSGSGLSTSSTDKIQMLTYNSIPWIVCATIHLMLALQGTVDVLGLRFSRGPVRCADCNRKIQQRQGKATDDGAGQSLLHADNESDDDDVESV